MTTSEAVVLVIVVIVCVIWDALIVRAAQRGGCAVLLTEDLQDGRVFDGVTIVNPFR